MNTCELTRLETKVAAALWALWRGERETAEDEINRRIYVDEVGEDVYADLVLTERAAYDASQARAKVVKS